MLAPDLPIRTPRLTLRGHREGDLDDLLAFHGDPEVVRYTPWPVRDRRLTEQALAQRIPQTSVERPGDLLCLAIEHAGRVVGEVLLIWRDETTAELGYALASAHHHRGLAAEAAAPMIDLAFDLLGTHRVAATVISANTASAAVLGKLGFRREGTLVEATAFEGGWADEDLYAVTADDWRRRRDLRDLEGSPPAASREEGASPVPGLA